jgi:hypothetical protein
MRKYLLAAVAALAIGASTAKAGTWWVLDSNTVTCVPAAAYANHDPAFASPFAIHRPGARWRRLTVSRTQKGRRRIEAAQKPWLKLEMSRRTWYRRQVEQRKGRE